MVAFFKSGCKGMAFNLYAPNFSAVFFRLLPYLLQKLAYGGAQWLYSVGGRDSGPGFKHKGAAGCQRVGQREGWAVAAYAFHPEQVDVDGAVVIDAVGRFHRATQPTLYALREA